MRATEACHGMRFSMCTYTAPSEHDELIPLWLTIQFSVTLVGERAQRNLAKLSLRANCPAVRGKIRHKISS